MCAFPVTGPKPFILLEFCTENNNSIIFHIKGKYCSNGKKKSVKNIVGTVHTNLDHINMI